MVDIATPYEDDFGKIPHTLCDWVKNFRIKKIQMKRKLRMGAGDKLRICAILSTALRNAEHELRLKQHERFNRWLELQAKLERNRCNEVNILSARENLFQNGGIDDDYVKKSDIATECKRREEEITKLWKYELSGLDEFMRNMSSSSNNSERSSVVSGSCKNDCKKDTSRLINAPQNVEVAS